MDIKDDIDNLLKRYPNLSFTPETNQITGVIKAGINDNYDVRIELGQYPSFFPHVFETSERIPRKAERHIYTDSNSCCFTTNAKAQVLLKTKITSLSLFIRDIVIPYFRNNSFYELNGFYSTEEYSHNLFGVIESYQDILKITNVHQIAKQLYNRLNGQKLKLHSPCYCGSPSTLKKCKSGEHLRAYRSFKLIEKATLESDFHNTFIKLYNKHSTVRNN